MADVTEYETHLPNPMHEVQDQSGSWVFFERLFDGYSLPLLSIDFGFYKFTLTKFMVLELVAALIIVAIYVPLAKSIRAGGLPRGRFWNGFEALLVFVRDEIARPNLGGAPSPRRSG